MAQDLVLSCQDLSDRPTIEEVKNLEQQLLEAHAEALGAEHSVTALERDMEEQAKAAILAARTEAPLK